MRLPHIATVAFLMIGLCGAPLRAAQNPVIKSTGPDTYTLKQSAKTGFDLDTDELKELALKNAAAFCAEQHKEMKVLETTVWRPKFRGMGISYAKIAFKALDADDPELHAPPSTPEVAAAATTAPAANAIPAGQSQTPTGQLYDDLLKLDDLRKRGILTEKEYEAQKKKLLKDRK